MRGNAAAGELDVRMTADQPTDIQADANLCGPLGEVVKHHSRVLAQGVRGNGLTVCGGLIASSPSATCCTARRRAAGSACESGRRGRKLYRRHSGCARLGPGGESERIKA